MKQSAASILCILKLIFFAIELPAQQKLELIIPVTHTGKIKKLAFSPDDLRLISIGEDSYLKIWDVNSGKLLKTIKHDDVICAAAYSNDGKKIITASFDRTIKIWDQNGNLIHTIKGHKGTVYDVKFSKNDNRILSASADGTAKIWDAATGELLITFKAHTEDVYTASFSDLENYVITTSFDSTAIVWNVNNGKMVHKLKGHKAMVNKGFILEDFNLIITASSDTLVKTWKLDEGTFVDNFMKPDIILNDIKVSRDGLKIAAATYRTTVINLGKRDLIRPKAIRNNVLAIDFDPSSSRLAAACADSTVYYWNITEDKIIRSFKTRAKPISLAVSNHNELLAVVTGENNISIWDANSGRIRQEMTVVKNAHVNEMLIAEKNDFLYVVSKGGDINKWNINTLQLSSTLHPHIRSLNSICFNHDKKSIITASSDSTIVYWNAGTFQKQKTISSATGKIFATEESHNGKYLLVEEYDRFYIRDVANGRVLKSFPQNDIVKCSFLKKSD